MNQPAFTHRTDAATPAYTARTIHVFGLLAACSMLLVWMNHEFVFTKEVFRELAGGSVNPYQSDLQYEALRRTSIWGYAFAPFQTAIRISLVALVMQMTCLLGGAEISFGKLFRIAAVAFFAILFGSFLQVVWIALQPTAAIDQAALGIVPDSVAAWFSTAKDAPLLLYLALSRVSLSSLLWVLLLYWGLRDTGLLGLRGAAAAVGVAWCISSALQVGTTMLLRSIVS